MSRHVVMWSSGITSWAVARLIADRHGIGDMVLLFADTLVEHPDNYRFSGEAAAQLGLEVTTVADGRTPQQVNRDSRWLSNTRVAKCSHVLKQEPTRRWLEANCEPDDTILYIGLDWTEPERVEVNRGKWAPWRTEFPLTEPPYYDKTHWIREAHRLGVEPPAMYGRGWPHANCGGACVRGGQAQWAHLLRENPDLFASWEQHEKDMQALLGEPVAILRDRTGGVTKPLPLTVLRRRVEAEEAGVLDGMDWGGCGCFTDFGGAA